jgi:hypothetical protein
MKDRGRLNGFNWTYHVGSLAEGNLDWTGSHELAGRPWRSIGGIVVDIHKPWIAVSI